MYLKRLDVQGFKSFADKISLEFNKGITSVVGPNGSGKSNISDAIRWVLGEQSAKTLRGSKMEDVIFVGTEHRKPVGFAEVSLTIDNTDGKLAVEYSEITVTRRVFRSGESEYFINKTPCRLKDIHELFMDTGLGRDGYSIIGQGRVDEILSTRSEDRRLIFEEASGIMKYKTRKLEAERKLEMTEQNLLRINDIIQELEKQLDPLKEQAETARKYLDLRENLKELDVNVFIDQIQKAREKVAEQEENYKVTKENIETENRKLEEITSANKEKTERKKTLAEQLDISKQAFYGIEGTLERCHSEIRVIDEKIASLEQSILRIDEEVKEMDGKFSSITRDETVKKEKLQYLEKRHADYLARLEESQKNLEVVLSSLNESERQIELMKAGIMDKLDLQSDKKTQINYVKTHMDNLAKRQKTIENEVYQAMLEGDREKTKKEDLEESLRKLREKAKDVTQQIEASVKKRNELDSSLSDLRKKQNTLRQELQFKSSRYKMLSEMEQNLEGYQKSVRTVLQACQQNPSLGRGIHGALAQLITVDKKYETAIEMALGGALQNIVAHEEEDAKKAIEFLKRNNLGRATFLPISSVKGKYLEGNYLEDARRHKGFLGVASDLVECNDLYKGIILSFLGRVVVVDNLDSGISLARQTRYSFRIVTLDGDILNTSGSMTGGSTDTKGSGILSRHREINELKIEVDELKKADEKLEQEIEMMVAGVEKASGEISTFQDELKNIELTRIRDESHLSQVEENISRSHARIDMLNQEKAQIIKQENETGIELAKYQEELLAIENEIEETKKIIAEQQDKNKEEQAARDALHIEITDYKISVNSFVESMESLKEALGKISDEREGLKKSVRRKTEEKDRNRNEIEKLLQSKEGILKSIKAHEEEKTGKTFEIDRFTEELKVLDEELSDTIEKITQQNKNIMLLQEEFGRIEVRKAKLEAEMEAIQNRMWDEYELTYSNALELKKDIGSISQAQKRINELKNQIRDLGQVNVAAIEEYVKTKERYEFMTAQKDDMEKAKEKLHRVIYEMTSIMKRQFLEQFKLINENFGAVFRELFDGGRAELILVDKENVLESGIEIEVQPPGKKLQNMMLLSGGERAFTAIALLFAILRLRPTPFCVLDEIEAALDDANVFRFARYLRKFSDESQFIVITHRKGTMEGSDMLYGVTMQEHGVSKVVSMRLGEQIA